MDSGRVRAYPIRDHLGPLVHEVARFRKAAFDRAFSALGITRAQRLVLIYITQSENMGVSQRDLAGLMKLTPVSLGEKLLPLEARGWIERRGDPADRRQRLIFLTDRGLEVLAESTRIAKELNSRLIESLAEDEVATAEHVLRTMRATLLDMGSASPANSDEPSE